jgi:hypothetical protein
VFYNNSAFDAFDPAPTAADDAAIAHDKRPLLPGATATPANFTNYSRGLNGLLIDVAGLWGDVTVDDFVFKTGRTTTSPTWAAAPAPSVLVRRGAGTSGSDRLSFTWPDGAVRNTWLQVTIKSSDRTGLAAPDVFYFGNLVGDAGGAIPGVVDAADVLAVRGARSVGVPGDIANPFDFNRDGRVNILDEMIARANQRRTLPLITADMPTPTQGSSHSRLLRRVRAIYEPFPL